MFIKTQYVLDESPEACERMLNSWRESMTDEEIERAMSDEFAYLDDDTED